MNICHIFPTSIGNFSLDRNFTKEELDFIFGLQKKPLPNNMGSQDTYIFKNQKLKNIANFCQNSVDEYFSKIFNPSSKVKCKITESWANYTSLNQSHHMHAHPNSFLSGVLYVNTTEHDNIVFYKSDYQPILIPTQSVNFENALSWSLSATIGTLYIFPSSLVHAVDNVENNNTRVSISFNSFPFGSIIGNPSTYLTIKDVE